MTDDCALVVAQVGRWGSAHRDEPKLECQDWIMCLMASGHEPLFGGPSDHQLTVSASSRPSATFRICRSCSDRGEESVCLNSGNIFLFVHWTGWRKYFFTLHGSKSVGCAGQLDVPLD